MNRLVRALAAASVVGVLAAAPALAARVTGVVTGPGGRPVEYATVAVPALKLGAITDDQGRFTLELPDGRHALVISQMGYRPARLEVEVRDGGGPLAVSLAEEPVPLAEVSVNASSYGKTGDAQGAVLRTIDVYTTPGAAADVFQAVRALPGTNAPVEGAALYVRGGEPEETLVRLDGGELGHPYHNEGASGGLFSALDAYMIESAFFSSGGFSARYGGVLSGVLDIRSRDPLEQRTVSVTAHMAGGAVSGTWPLVRDKLALIGSVSRSNPALLFRLYGTATEFETSPTGGNGFGRLLWRYSPAGRLSLSGFDASDNVGLTAQILNSANRLDNRTTNRIGSLDLDDVVAGRIALRAQASWQAYETEWSLGPFGGARRERNLQANVDAAWPLSPDHLVGFGANLRHRDTRIEGRFAADSTDYLPGAPTRSHLTHPRIDYPGVWIEDKLRVVGPLYATLGVRADWASRPGEWTADPRAALAWRVDEHQTLRVATGRYHQLAKAIHLDPVYGNPDLRPLRADHVIAGYEWLSEFGTVRLEAYRKDYRGLVTNDSTAFYANRGHGHARGLDVLVQGTFGWLSGWVSYGWLDSKRKELDHPEEVPTAYGVAHTLNVVSRYKLTSQWELGSKIAWSTGRAFTPVVGRSHDASRGIWHPVYGAHHSERLPDYQRVDVRLTRLFSLPEVGGLPESGVCVFFVEMLNALGKRNLLEYVYSEDYSERRALESYFSRRMAVAGFSLSW